MERTTVCGRRCSDDGVFDDGIRTLDPHLGKGNVSAPLSPLHSFEQPRTVPPTAHRRVGPSLEIYV